MEVNRNNTGSKAWSKEKLAEQITALENKSNTTLESQKIMLYVLSPYIASLGYNIFNIEEVDIQVSNELVYIQVCKEFATVISLEEYFPTEDNVKVFVALNAKERIIQLYVKALGEWELLHLVNLNKKAENNDLREYENILTYLVKQSVIDIYSNKQDRMFTEGVLRSKLNKDEMDNAFVREVISDELKNPSKKFLQVIAEGLAHKFSSEPIPNLVKGIENLSETGVVELVDGVISDIKAIKKKQFSFNDNQLTTEKQAELENLESMTEFKYPTEPKKEEIIFDDIEETEQKEEEEADLIVFDTTSEKEEENLKNSEEDESFIFDRLEEDAEKTTIQDVSEIFMTETDEEGNEKKRKMNTNLTDLFGI